MENELTRNAVEGRSRKTTRKRVKKEEKKNLVLRSGSNRGPLHATAARLVNASSATTAIHCVIHPSRSGLVDGHEMVPASESPL